MREPKLIPMQFSGKMVKAILNGSKIETRRLLPKTPPEGHELVGIYAPRLTAVFNPAGRKHRGDPEQDFSVELPPMPRDLIWVREHWKTTRELDAKSPSQIIADSRAAGYEPGWAPIEYLADASRYYWPIEDPAGRHRQAMHMPMPLSRLTLAVRKVRVERLQDITEAAAIYEGIERPRSGRGYYDPTMSKGIVRTGHCFHNARQAFAALWDELNSHRAPWNSNPWVYVTEFVTIRENVLKVAA